MAEKRKPEKLVKTKRKNSPTEDWPIHPRKRPKITDICQSVIDYLKSKQSDPNFKEKCGRIYELFED